MIEQAILYCKDHPIDGVLVEFGVWQGAGLSSIYAHAQAHLGDIPLYGFDSFKGMPPSSVDLHDNCKEVWRPGGYGDTSPGLVWRRVPTAHLIPAVFSDLLPLREYGIDKVRFARLDCDIYEGYRDALNLLTPTLSVGSVLLFDEAVAPDDERYHDGVRDSGERAVREWQDRTGIRLRVLNSVWTECLTVVESL